MLTTSDYVMKQTEKTPNDIHDNPLYKAFAGGDNDLALCLIAVEYLEKRFTSIEIKIEDDYLAERIAQEVMKNNNELYKKFSDEMREQNKEFNDAMREQNKEFNDAMREQNDKFNSKLQMHTYWTVGTIIATGAVLAAFLQL